MNNFINSTAEKELRSMWLGFFDNSFDKTGRTWSFTGEPYTSRVGAHSGQALVFDGSTSISTSNIPVAQNNWEISFYLQLAANSGSITVGSYSAPLSNSSYFPTNSLLQISITPYSGYGYDGPVFFKIKGGEGRSTSQSYVFDNISTFAFNEGMVGFLSDFSITSNGAIISDLSF